MQLSTPQLAAFVAVLREGRFDAAAKTLHITPSAVSQRIRQLEEQLGAVVLVRTTPCVATPVGLALYRHAQQVELLERDLLQTVAPEGEAAHEVPLAVSIAVNADSLATWIVPALDDFAADSHARVDIRVDDEGSTTQWLRTGEVLGAVTSIRKPVHGCTVEPLGVMRYVATASPRFVRRWMPQGISAKALRDAPCLAYDRSDTLCAKLLRRELRGRAVELTPHRLPSPNAYVEATLCGLGWGMNPEALVGSHLKRRRLVDLFPGTWIDVPLYWQQWGLHSSTVSRLADSLRTHAAGALRSV